MVSRWTLHLRILPAFPSLLGYPRVNGFPVAGRAATLGSLCHLDLTTWALDPFLITTERTGACYVISICGFTDAVPANDIVFRHLCRFSPRA